MSLVTNHILCVSVDDGPDLVELVNEALKGASVQHGTGEFVPVHNHSVGTKAMEVDVYVAAFNYIDVQWLGQMVIECADRLGRRDGLFNCQLLTRLQDEDFFEQTFRFEGPQ